MNVCKTVTVNNLHYLCEKIVTFYETLSMTVCGNLFGFTSELTFAK